MFAMFYEFGLPDGYDMGLVRRRVADTAPFFDRYPGLHRKVFLANDTPSEALGEAFGKSYGAFYLWHSATAARDFLLGPNFDALCAAFGRPRVKTWLVLSAVDRQIGSAARATIETARFGDGSPIAPAPFDSTGHLDRDLRLDGVVAEVVGFNPHAWDSLRVRLWRGADDAALPKRGESRIYAVLHVSQPETSAAVTPVVAPDLLAPHRSPASGPHSI